jgi:hypothetical protein
MKSTIILKAPVGGQTQIHNIKDFAITKNQNLFIIIFFVFILYIGAISRELVAVTDGDCARILHNFIHIIHKQ